MRKQDYKFAVGNRHGVSRAGATLRQSRELRASRAFTLAELLIVAVIISVVTIATIPLLKPAMDSRRIREAARIVSTQFASAQGEAVASGHSVGVWLQKIPAGGASSGTVDGDASMDLYLCESPQPYSGDSESSTVIVSVSGAPPTGSVTMSNADSGWIGLLRPGDLIRFNHSGPYYSLGGATQPQPDGTLMQATAPTATIFSMTPVSQDDFDTSGHPVFRYLPPVAFVSAGNPNGWTTNFQILRQPVRSSATPMQLPSGAIVDLFFSGIGNPDPVNAISGYFGSIANFDKDNNPVIVTFDRTGALEYLYVGGTQYSITLPLYFLIGKREKAPSVEPDPTRQNFVDQDNLWISLNPQSGLASTAEVAAPNSSGFSQQVINSRSFATAAQAMGGK
jgi:type II secretory pathway pseudopilin PulG